MHIYEKKKRTNTPHAPADYSHHKPQTALPAAHAGTPPRRVDRRNSFVVGARNSGLVGRRKVEEGSTLAVAVEEDIVVVAVDCTGYTGRSRLAVEEDSRREVVVAGEDIGCKGRTFLPGE